MTVVFYIAGAVALLSTLLVVTCRNTIHALLYLVVSLLAVASSSTRWARRSWPPSR